MKRKLLTILTTVLAVMMTLFVVTACSNSHEHAFSSSWSSDENSHYHACTVEGCTEKADVADHSWTNETIITRATRVADGEKEFTCEICGKTKTESYELKAPTAAQAFSARQAVVEDTVNGYDFNFSLSCELGLLGMSSTISGNYAGKYRNNETTGAEQFTRTTSGALFFDSTVYTYTKNSQKIQVDMNSDGTVKKSSVMRQQDEEGFFINKAVSALVDEIQAANYNNIVIAESGEHDFSSSLNFGANNSYLGKISSLFSNFGTKIAFKSVEFTNPTAIPFSFTINEDGKLEDFTLNLSVDIAIKAANVTVSIIYTQKSATTEIQIPKDETLIVGETEIDEELGAVNTFLATLKNNEDYSLDLTARNEFDPAWNKLATVDYYTARLFKNTVDSNVWFNHSYEYKAHHEEDGAEKYAFTIGNIEDGSVHLVSRKGNNQVSAIEGKTVNTQFDYMVTPFLFSSNDVDCIKKETKNNTTTLNVHLNNQAAKEIQNTILDIVNSNDAEGVLDVNNYMNQNVNIKDATFVIVYENGVLTEIKIKTDIKYNPTAGEYTDYNITLTNELELLVNKYLDDASDYEAPSSATGNFLGLESSKYYIR